MKNKQERKYGTKKQIAAVNTITGLRFLASFLIIPIFKTLGGIAAGTFAIIFSVTDWIDGLLARKLKSSTFFGSIFDGISDKAFGITILSLLMTVNPIVFSIPLLCEIGIVIAQAKKAKKGLNVKSNMIGKIKMWSLCLTSIASFYVIDIFDMPFIIDYIKNSSLDKVACIKDFLVLLGVNLPTIVLQALTMSSYAKESKEQFLEEQPVEEIKNEQTNKLEDNPEYKLKQIRDKKNKLKEEYTFLEKAKIIKEKLFDPEYYEVNKDRKIGTLTRELFKRK